MTDQFTTEMLEAHNKYRAIHQSPPLQYDKDLGKTAKKWAKKLAEQDNLEHDSSGCQKLESGENVAMKYNSQHTDFKGHEFTDYWYSEVQNYDFQKENQINCGHFTQVVWQSSKSCGFGRAVSKSGKVYVVGRYKPPANFTDEFCKNVLPPKDGKIVLPEAPSQSAAGSGSTTVNKPVIGPKNPEDILLGCKKSVTSDSNSITEKIEETYQTPGGEQYSRVKEINKKQ